MKRLNFQNQDTDDDEKLISLLKTSMGLEPPEQFVENSLEKFLIIKASQENTHNHLKFPLYLMLVIGLILLVPVSLAHGSKESLLDSRSELGNLLDAMSFQLDSWYALTPLLIIFVLISVVWVELDLVRLRNPFV